MATVAVKGLKQMMMMMICYTQNLLVFEFNDGLDLTIVVMDHQATDLGTTVTHIMSRHMLTQTKQRTTLQHHQLSSITVDSDF